MQSRSSLSGLKLNQDKTEILIQPLTNLPSTPCLAELIPLIRPKTKYLGYRIAAATDMNKLLLPQLLHIEKKLKILSLSAKPAAKQLKWLNGQEILSIWRAYGLLLIDYVAPIMNFAPQKRIELIECQLINFFKAAFGMSIHASRSLMLIMALGMKLKDYATYIQYKLSTNSSLLDQLSPLQRQLGLRPEHGRISAMDSCQQAG